MATATARAGATTGDGLVLVDPRAPRFGQFLTASGLLLGIVLQSPILVLAVAVVLNTAVLSRWRFHPYSLLWRHAMAPVVSATDEPEPAAPHRFATLVGAVGTAVASVAIAAGVPVLGYALAGLVAAAAGFGATTGFCLGCYFYQHVTLFRRLDLV